jgi:drug/metabolite transporter (DMT)-like permease
MEVEVGPSDGLGSRLLLAELGLGVVYGGMTIAFFESLTWLSAGVATLLLYTYPVLVTVIATVVLDESMTVSKALALGCTVSGVGLIASVDALALSALGAAATIVPYGLLAGTLSIPATGTAWGLIGGITLVATIIPLLAFNEGLARIEASSASIVSTAEPLTTVVLGALLLGEVLTPATVLGGAAILLGVVLTTPLGGTLRRVRSRLTDRNRPTEAEPETDFETETETPPEG